jgi:hypothetical protein
VRKTLFTEQENKPMTNPRVLLLTLLLTVLLVTPSFAHHSIAALFDTSKTQVLKGTITKLEWRNPHAAIYLDVRDSSGKITNWYVEMASIGNLAKAGLDQSLIDVTQTYSMEVFLAKDGKAQAVGITLIFPDSKSFDVSEKPDLSPRAK